MTDNDLRWGEDKNGDTLWRGGEFLGCIYSREYCGSHSDEYRILIGEDLNVLTDVKGGTRMDARARARETLEAHCGHLRKLPTAKELLEMS